MTLSVGDDVIHAWLGLLCHALGGGAGRRSWRRWYAGEQGATQLVHQALHAVLATGSREASDQQGKTRQGASSARCYTGSSTSTRPR